MGVTPEPVDLTRALTGATVAVAALARHHGPLDRLRALTSALGAAERLAARLRTARDQQIADVAQTGKHGYTQIGRAAGMSASRASRVARATGAPARRVVEGPLPPTA